MRGWSSYRIERQPWFTCACCPPNVARLIASLGGYLYSQAGREVAVHLYAASRATLAVDGVQVELTQETDYPWEGAIRLSIAPEQPVRLTLALRIPGWCHDAALRVNGQPTAMTLDHGYVRVERRWQAGDVVELDLAMPVERVEAHPWVRHDAGRVALMRGPLVYCLEEVDNGPALSDLALPHDAVLTARWAPDLLGGIMVIEGQGLRRDVSRWAEELYRPAGTPTLPVPLRAIPYYAWANRGVGEMNVWIREC